MFGGELNCFSNIFKPYPMQSSLDPHVEHITSIIVRNFYYFLGHERTIIWRKSINIFLSNPLKGYGLNFFPVDGMPGVHNSFVRVMLSAGIVGIIFYCLGWFLIFLNLIKKIKCLSDWRLRVFFIAVFWALISWQIQGLSQTLINNYIVWFFIAISFLKPAIFSVREE